MIFSEKLRLLRKKNGFTQETLAKEIGVTRQAIYKWEDGQAYPELDKLLKLRTLFQASIDNMIDDGYSVSEDGTLKTNAEVEYENEHRKKRKPRKDKGIKTGIPPMRKNGEPVVRRKKVEGETEEAVSEPIQRDAVAAARAAIEARRQNAARQAEEEAAEEILPDDDSVVIFTPGEKPTAAPIDEVVAEEAKQPKEKLYSEASDEAENEEKEDEQATVGESKEEPKKRRGFFSFFRRK